MLAGTALGMSGCVVYSPAPYDGPPGYAYAPGYVYAPPVYGLFDFSFGEGWGHRWGHGGRRGWR